MTGPDKNEECSNQELRARKIELKDGRYMIFFEFGTDAELKTAEAIPDKEPTMENV
jgi:hypothetical protein